MYVSKNNTRLGLVTTCHVFSCFGLDGFKFLRRQFFKDFLQIRLQSWVFWGAPIFGSALSLVLEGSSQISANLDVGQATHQVGLHQVGSYIYIYNRETYWCPNTTISPFYMLSIQKSNSVGFSRHSDVIPLFKKINNGNL